MSAFISVLSFILSIIAIILIIGLLFFVAFQLNLWTYKIGNISAGQDSFSPTYNSIYKPNLTGGLTLTIQPNRNGYIGETFMIDNTQNPHVIVVKNGSNITISDNVGQGNIAANTSALYIWSSETNINRLY